MWAQRQGSLYQPQEHEAIAFDGKTDMDVAAQIHERCEKFRVRVAHVSAYAVMEPYVHPNGDHRQQVTHYAIVVFEREPIQR
jgi:hypothetical protein